MFTQPALFVWVEECVHQVIAVILRNLERLFLNAIVQTLQIIDIHSIKHFLYLIDIRYTPDDKTHKFKSSPQKVYKTFQILS